jgi:hypothetical protein
MIFKQDPVVEGDLVLIHIENKPALYARVEKITADVKPNWWRVQFLMLTIPVQLVTWIIDDEQIRGANFTMDGTPIRIEKVVPPKEIEPATAPVPEEVKQRNARVLSLHKNDK